MPVLQGMTATAEYFGKQSKEKLITVTGSTFGEQQNNMSVKYLTSDVFITRKLAADRIELDGHDLANLFHSMAEKIESLEKELKKLKANL